MGLTSGRGSEYDAGRARPGNGRDDGYAYGRPDDFTGRHTDGYGRLGTGPRQDTYDGPQDGAARPSRDALDFGRTDEQGSGLLDGYLSRVRLGRRAGRRRGGSHKTPVMAVVAVVASIAVVAAAAGAARMLTANNAANATVNMNCTLIVPANPLTAQGLATPYQLTATNPADGPCNEANPNQTAFVQAAVLNPRTGKMWIYDPLVVDVGTAPAIAPVVPSLPRGAVVAVWFGYNGNTLSFQGPDQPVPVASQTSISSTTSASATATPTTASPSATASQTSSATPTDPGTATATPTFTVSDSPADSATPTASPTVTTSPTQGNQDTQSPSGPATATDAATPAAAAEAEGAAPLSPGSSAAAQYSGSLTQIGQSGNGGQGSDTQSASASASASQAAATPTATASPTAATPTASPSPSMGANPVSSLPPVNPGDTPAAEGTPDATLQQAHCIAGEDMDGQFSSFTQVGACNAVAFFRAANADIWAGKLRVPSPGYAVDGMNCLTTRSFALVDQDQSDNVTTEYLANGNGQIAQDTAANRQALNGATTLFNGSDNGLLDLFVDPALGCHPWEEPNLADNGAPAPALPLDELQAARWAGHQGSGPAALVPLNDPMTLDNNGNFSTDKTNAYRLIVDMPPLPAGESPSTYCSDIEQIQTTRLQQDVNLLINGPSPAPAAADNLFTFMAMRLQQSFMNLNCANFGMQNDVTTTVDGNGVVVAACFLDQVAPVTSGAGNPTAGMTICPSTQASPSAAATTSAAATPGGTPSSSPAWPTPSSTAYNNRWGHPKHHHWWW